MYTCLCVVVVKLILIGLGNVIATLLSLNCTTMCENRVGYTWRYGGKNTTFHTQTNTHTVCVRPPDCYYVTEYARLKNPARPSVAARVSVSPAL